MTNVVPFPTRPRPPRRDPAEALAMVGVLGRAHEMYAEAVQTARMHERAGNTVMAKERLLTCARDLARLASEYPAVGAIGHLAETAAQASINIRAPRRKVRNMVRDMLRQSVALEGLGL